MLQPNKKEPELGFFKSARGQLALIIAAMIVISIFAWSFIR